ncbi:MAG: PEP-CTERM sorting domain-containing protein [Verrucomicrobiota bacterium]
MRGIVHLSKLAALFSLVFFGQCIPLSASSILMGNRFNSATGTQEFVHIDRVTGAITPVGPGVTGSPAISATAEGLALGGFYSIRAQPSGQSAGLYSFDVASGAIVNMPAFPTNIGGMRYGAGGSILGLRFNAGTEELLSVDPVTGSISTIGLGIPNIGVFNGQATYDPVNDVYSFLGTLNDGMGLRIFSLNASTGALIGSPLYSPPSSVGFWNYDNSGRILGLRFDSGTERLVAIDPATAVVTDIGSGIAGFGSVVGSGSYDPVDNAFTFAGNRSGEGRRLFTLDAATGAILSEPSFTTTINGLTYAPEPSVSLLLISAIGMVLSRRRRTA